MLTGPCDLIGSGEGFFSILSASSGCVPFWNILSYGCVISVSASSIQGLLLCTFQAVTYPGLGPTFIYSDLTVTNLPSPLRSFEWDVSIVLAI